LGACREYRALSGRLFPEGADTGRSKLSFRGEEMIKFGSLLVLIAIPLSAVENAMAQSLTPISVSMTNYAFTPTSLILKAGTAYQMHFINDGTKDHNFSAPGFFAASHIAADDQAKVTKGLVALERGQTVDIIVTPDQPGTFAVECTHFMHSMMGMHGSIVVQ